VPSRDHSLPLRQAIVEKLLASDTIVAIVEDRVYGQKPDADPTIPFIRTGPSVSTPYEATGWGEGSEGAVVVHAFAQGPGEDKCSQLAAEIVAVLEEDSLPLEGIGLVGIQWERTQVLPDLGATDSWHAVINFRATTAETVAA